MVSLGRLVAAAGAFGTAAVACGVYGAHQFRVSRVSLPVLPVGALPVRVLHVSDIHMVPGQAAKVKWLSDLAQLEPDLVVNTGDNFGHSHAVDPLVEALGPLAQFPGVFVMGNNDYFGPCRPKVLKYFKQQESSRPRVQRSPQMPVEQLRSVFTDFGWLDVSNTEVSIRVAGQEFTVVGVDDPHLGRDEFPGCVGGPVRLGLLHAPYRRVLDAMAADGVRVMFAGHTHGGQVCLPGGRALITNSDVPLSYARGAHRWPPTATTETAGSEQGAHVSGMADGDVPAGGSWLHVSAGVGSAPLLPVRFWCPPEATLLTLTAEATSPT